MKKLSLIFALIAMCSLTWATETTLYSQEFTCADDWSSGYAQIEKASLSGAVAGDEINVYVTAISTGTEWPQVYLQYVDAEWNWVDFTDTHNYGLAGQTAPHTNIAPYNNLTVIDKQLIINPELMHQVSGTWYSDMMAFFAARIDNTTTGVEAVSNQSALSQKFFRDGQLIIVRNNQMYNALGQQL